MTENNTNKFSTWILWSPLKFAVISFCVMISTAFFYSLIAGAIYNPSGIPQTPLWILLAIGFICSIAFQFKKLPRDKMDRTSFIAIHNTQTIVLSGLFLISAYLISRHAQQIMFTLLMMETRISATFLIVLGASLLFYLYLIGLLVANICAKVRRIREFNIPTWKIVCSMPFGFSALWTPGYILDANASKVPSYTPKSELLNRANNRIISTTTYTIATFIAITLLSGFFFGFNSVLLTFSLTLIFGIWAIQVGTKKFIKSMPDKYSTSAVIFNIALLIITIVFFSLAPATTPDAQITISDTEITETITQ